MKKNSLKTTLIGRIETTIDRYYIIIYKSYNIITKAKDS